MTIPLSMQVANFAETRAQLKSLLGGFMPLTLSRFLSKSLFVIGVSTGMDLLPGSNPFSSLFPPHDNKTQAQRLKDLLRATLTTLHGMGARKFAVINVGLIGCTPLVQSSPGHGGNGPCDDNMNRFAAEFNAAVGTLLTDLAAELHHFRYSLANFYSLSNATFANPSAFGRSTELTACMFFNRDNIYIYKN